MTRLSAIIIFSAGLFASQVNAFSVEQCDRFSFGHHAGDSQHMDIGNGHVVFRRFADFTSFEQEPTSISKIIIAQCETGKELLITAASQAGDDMFNFEDHIRSELEYVVQSRQAYTLEMLEVLFDGITDNKAVIRDTNEESCACHIVYPELRGTKKLFDTSEIEQ
jgi:hypothetical protein